MTANDKEHLAAMRKLGVRWKRGRAVPTYPAKMTQAQRDAADRHYDAISEAGIDSMGALPAPRCEYCGSQDSLHKVGCIIIADQYYIDTGRHVLKYTKPGDYKRPAHLRGA